MAKKTLILTESMFAQINEACTNLSLVNDVLSYFAGLNKDLIFYKVNSEWCPAKDFMYVAGCIDRNGHTVYITDERYTTLSPFMEYLKSKSFTISNKLEETNPLYRSIDMKQDGLEIYLIERETRPSSYDGIADGALKNSYEKYIPNNFAVSTILTIEVYVQYGEDYDIDEGKIHDMVKSAIDEMTLK